MTQVRQPLPPAGHYSPVVWHGDTAYVSGQLPIDREGNPLADQPFAVQVAQVLTNLSLCLESVGLVPDSIVQVRVYITDIGNWPEFDAQYAAWIGEHRPARAVVEVQGLHYGTAVEVEAIAGREA